MARIHPKKCCRRTSRSPVLEPTAPARIQFDFAGAAGEGTTFSNFRLASPTRTIDNLGRIRLFARMSRLPRRIDLMTRIRWPALLVLLFPGAAQAQFLLPFGGFDLGFTKVKRHSAFSFSLTRGYRGAYGPFYGNPYGPPVPFGGIAVTEVRIITPPPIIVQAPPVPAEVLAP